MEILHDATNSSYQSTSLQIKNLLADKQKDSRRRQGSQVPIPDNGFYNQSKKTKILTYRTASLLSNNKS